MLAWDSDVLYASRGYTLLRAKIKATRCDGMSSRATGRSGGEPSVPVPSSEGACAGMDFMGWRSCRPDTSLPITGSHRHAATGRYEFRVTHRVLRGTRPLHIAVTPENRSPSGRILDNAERGEVHVFASDDRGATWDVVYTFAKGEIRHIHNIRCGRLGKLPLDDDGRQR